MAFQTRRKYCFFKENNISTVDYKDVKLLKEFGWEHKLSLEEGLKIAYEFYLSDANRVQSPKRKDKFIT